MKYINLLITLTTLAMINIVVSIAMAIRATVPESLSAGCGDDCCVFDWLFPATLTSTVMEKKKEKNRLIYFLFRFLWRLSHHSNFSHRLQCKFVHHSAISIQWDMHMRFLHCVLIFEALVDISASNGR